jgi:hypothetical protein
VLVPGFRRYMLKIEHSRIIDGRHAVVVLTLKLS